MVIRVQGSRYFHLNQHFKALKYFYSAYKKRFTYTADQMVIKLLSCKKIQKSIYERFSIQTKNLTFLITSFKVFCAKGLMPFIKVKIMW